MRRFLRFVPHSWLATWAAWRGESAARRRQAEALAHLRSVATRLSARCLGEIHSIEDWHRRRAELRRQFAWMLGLEPMPERSALSARVVGSIDHAGCRVEKLVFESLPGLLVTANFYLPEERSGALPCVLYLCGHLHHRRGAKALYQDRCWWYAQNGFACLVLDPLESGEVPGIHHGTHSMGRWDWFSMAYTPAGVEVWNAMRALDWLQTRQEVDARRIGVTGISGGGVMSWFLAALDERVAAVVPTCASYTVGSQVKRKLLPWQCDCIFYPNLFQVDFPAVAALVAPRPVLILNGAKDPVFPPAGYRDLFARVRRIWDLHGASERIKMVEFGSGHEDTPQTLLEARTWLSRWLLPHAAEGGGLDEPTLISPERIACLSGAPPTAANYAIDRHFIGAVLPVSEGECLVRRTEAKTLVRDLRATVFRWFPEQDGIPFRPRRRPYATKYLAAYTRVEECTFESEPGVRVRALLCKPSQLSAGVPSMVVIKPPASCRHYLDFYDLLPVLGTRAVLLVYPRFSECALMPWALADLQRAAALVGRTIASMQVWDTVRAVRWLLEEPDLRGSPVAVTGRGAHAVTALYAGLLESRVQHIILEEPPASQKEAPPLLGVLRITDLPEAAGLLAPRRLTLVAASDPRFELAKEMYEAAGASSAFAAADSVSEAVLQEDGAAARPKVPGRVNNANRTGIR